MSRRVVLQVVVFILLCVPLLSLVSFLVYSAIPHPRLVILHPLSCVLFGMVGLYGASVLHEWRTASRFWYWSAVALLAMVGICCAVAYVLSIPAPFVVLNVAIATGAAALFLLLGLYMVCAPFIGRRMRRVCELIVMLIILYLVVAPYSSILIGVNVWYVFLPVASGLLSMSALVVIAEAQESVQRDIPIGTFVIQPYKTNILATIEAVVQEYESVYMQKKIDLAVTIPKRLPAVLTDTVVLRVVLGTILRNVYEIAPARGTITFEVKTVSIKRVPQCIVISCTDTTTVLPPKTLRALFQNSATVELAEYTVLESLHTSKRMLSAIGAELLLVSQEGEGTTVTITLPSAVTEAPKVL